jgi:amidase
LPVSLKDNFNVAGLDTTLGFVAWANDPATAEKESILVKQLRDLGAIVLCKTYILDLQES